MRGSWSRKNEKCPSSTYDCGVSPTWRTNSLVLASQHGRIQQFNTTHCFHTCDNLLCSYCATLAVQESDTECATERRYFFSPSLHLFETTSDIPRTADALAIAQSYEDLDANDIEDEDLPEDVEQSHSDNDNDPQEGTSTAVRVKKVGKKRAEKLKRKEHMRQYREVNRKRARS